MWQFIPKNAKTITNNTTLQGFLEKSNVNTIGYKKQRAEFADLFYQTMEYAGTSTSTTTQSPTGISVGLGVRPTAVTKIFTQGNFKETHNNLDVAIQ